MPLPRCAVECTLVADPELRFSPSGVAVASLRLVATDRRFNREANEWEDGDKLWFDAVCFKQLAENTVESVGKGDRVIVTGKWRTEEWENREGEKRSKISFTCDTVSPSLVFATAKVTRASRSGSSDQKSSSTDSSTPRSSGGSNDPWASQSDEPPF